MADNLFGDYIRQRREDAWLTRTELAKKANLSVSLIEKIELGTRPPTLHSLQILFDHLDVAPMFRRHILDLSLPGLFGPPPTAPSAPDADDLADLAVLDHPASFYTLPALTIAAANAAHRRTFPGLVPGTSFLEWIFLEPIAREVIVEWRKEARRCIHTVRQLSPASPRTKVWARRSARAARRPSGKNCGTASPAVTSTATYWSAIRSTARSGRCGSGSTRPNTRSAPGGCAYFGARGRRSVTGRVR